MPSTLNKLFYFFLLFLLLPILTNSTELPPVVINEIAAYESGNHEWIEILNISEESVNLEGWKFFEDEVNHSLSLFQGEDFILETGEYAIIADVAENFINDYSEFTGTLFDSAWSTLREDGEEIGLKNSEGELVEIFTYPEARDFSLERADPLLLDYTINNWQEHVDGNSVGVENSNFEVTEVTDVTEVTEESDLEAPMEVGGLDASMTINLNWQGSVSEDLVGYKLYVNDEEAQDLGDVLNYEVQELDYGLNYNFKITSYDEDGNESEGVVLSLVAAGCLECEVCPVVEPVECFEDEVTEVTDVTEDTDEPEEIQIDFEPSDLVINEFVADPVKGEEEWIELYNNLDIDVDLIGWTLEEGAGKATDLEGIILAKNFLTFEPSGNLNNGGDIIILRDANQNIIDKITYGNWDDGELEDNAPKSSDPDSVARLVDGEDSDNDYEDFEVTTTPTKDLVNQIISKEKETTSSVRVIVPQAISEPEIQINYSDKIIINEFVPNVQGSDSGNEWIELKNIGDKDVDLENWLLADATSRKYKIKKDDFSSTIIKAGGFFVLGSDKTKISLNNSGEEKVRLFWPSADDPVDEINYSGKVEDDWSYALIEGEWGWTVGASKGSENVLIQVDEIEEVIEEVTEVAEASKAKKVYEPIRPGEILITEILPNPEGPENGEFVEIFNNSEKEINLTDWQLDDMEGGSKPHKIEEVKLKPKEFYTFKREESKLAFNNDEDEVRLIQPGGEIYFSLMYEQAKEAQSYSLDENKNWFWTTSLTPKKENIISVLQKTDLDKKTNPSTRSSASGGSGSSKIINKTTLKELKFFPKGDKVKVKGVVSVEPGVLGSQYFYVAGSGVQVYMSKKDFPELKLGDEVELTGELSESYGERRIKISQKEDIKVLGSSEAPTPHEVEVSEVGEETEGYLITVTGEVVDIKGSTIYLDDGTEEVLVYLKKAAGLKKSQILSGDTLKITGIVNQSKKGHQILPRYQSDIKLLNSGADEIKVLGESMEVNDKGSEMIKYLGVVAGALVIGLGGLFVKKRLAAKNEEGDKAKKDV